MLVKNAKKWYKVPQNLANKLIFEDIDMKGKSPDSQQLHIFNQRLEDLLNPMHSLYKLAKRIPWERLDNELSGFYPDKGRPSNPVRLMAGLLILKQIHNLSDESIIEHWVENPYFQFFCGEVFFQWKTPTHPTDLVHFRKRIGEEGIANIFQISIELHGKKAMEKEVLVDTTVQEKNITFPTDVKLYKKIIDHCLRIAKKEDLILRQSYKRTVKKFILAQRYRKHPKNFKKAITAQRKLKTIAGRLTREIERKLNKDKIVKYSQSIEIFNQILTQQQNSKNKIYSIHEPHVYCMSKGKEHKRYEFGAKASVVVTRDSGIVIGALSFTKNRYDGHTLPFALQQTEELIGKRPEVAIVDRGYRGKKIIDGTMILTPKPPGKQATQYEKQKARKRFRRRAAIEPIIGHLKSDYRLVRNFLKGSIGDSLNLMLSAAAFNFKKWMRDIPSFLFIFYMSFSRKNSRILIPLLYKNS